MADISKIKLPNGTTYAVKDAKAQHIIKLANEDLNNVVDAGIYYANSGNTCTTHIAIDDFEDGGKFSLEVKLLADGDSSTLVQILIDSATHIYVRYLAKVGSIYLIVADWKKCFGYMLYEDKVKLDGIHSNFIGGNATAAVTTSPYKPNLWKFNARLTATDGMVISITAPNGGHDYGTFLSMNNGSNYYPIVLSSTGRMTTHYPSGSQLLLAFDSDGSAANVFPVAGATARQTVTGGVWRVLNYYDSGNTISSAYCTTKADTAAKTASCNGYILLNKSYIQVIISNANTSATALTLNINSRGAKPIYINGSASSTTNYTLPAGSYLVYYDGTNYYFRTDGKITGNITGNCSGTAANVTGTVAVANGGTGATTAANARTNLGLGGAAVKGVDTSISASSSSANLPTSAAVASFVEGKGYKTTDNDTKNTAGSTNTTSKIYLIGATSQAANPQTYSSENMTLTPAGNNTTYGDYTLLALGASNRQGVIRFFSKNTYYNQLLPSPSLTKNQDIVLPSSAGTLAITTSSSRKYKENIQPITEDEAKKILDVNIVSFDYINKENYGDRLADGRYGVIAEELNEIIPSAVLYDGDWKPDAVDYAALVPHLIKMVQMQQKEIEFLKNKLN